MGAYGHVCLTCASPLRLLYSFLLSWYGSCRPYKHLLRDNAANHTYVPAPIRALARLHLAPTRLGAQRHRAASA
jgi:hypothetical protein